MCIEYSGGLTYRDGCRKKEMEAPLITCKLRPFGRSGKPGDARMCKNYFFVKFGWHRIWTLACPEHWDDEVGFLDLFELWIEVGLMMVCPGSRIAGGIRGGGC